MWSAWQADRWVPWWRRQRWRDRSIRQRTMIVGVGVFAWLALVTAYGLGQRAGNSERDAASDGTVRSVAVPAAAVGAQARASVPTTVAAAEQAAPEPPPVEPPPAAAAPPPPAPVAARAAEPAPAAAPARAPRTTSCDAVADLGTVEPGDRLAFQLDPRCPFRPGSVDIAVNGEPPRRADVDENGVVWVEVE